MKIALSMMACLALASICQAFDMNSLVNGMLDNALEKAGKEADSTEPSTTSTKKTTKSKSSTKTKSTKSDTSSSGSSASSTGGSDSSSSDSAGNTDSGEDGGFLKQLGGKAMEKVVPAVKSFAVNAVNSFFNKLVENQLNRNYHDDIFMHRAVRVYKTGDTSVVVLDRTSGIKVPGEGDTAEEAIENATKTMVETLLATGQMTVLDLGLTEPIKPVVVHCVDKFGKKFCSDMKRRGFCETGHHMELFVADYCRRTCSNC